VDLGASGDLVGYVRRLERALIALAADFGVRATTIEGLTGVWVGDAKIGAIGVHVSRGITTHGFAFNVEPDLDAFNGIVPCGIVDKSVTSLAALSGRRVPMSLVFKRAGEQLATALDRELRWRHPTVLLGQEERLHG
jgi:lipoyl(octanoyl) transferase